MMQVFSDVVNADADFGTRYGFVDAVYSCRLVRRVLPLVQGVPGVLRCCALSIYSESPWRRQSRNESFVTREQMSNALAQGVHSSGHLERHMTAFPPRSDDL